MTSKCITLTLHRHPPSFLPALGYCDKAIPVPRVLCHNLKEVTEVPGKGMGFLQNNLQKFQVRVRKRYRIHRSCGYYGMGVHNSQNFPVGLKILYPYPGIVVRAYRTHRSSGNGYGRHTELTKVPGTGMNALRNLQKFFVG